jgi:RIO-like serine/threonine protein kinase
LGIQPLRHPSSTRPAIWLLKWRGKSLVVKDYRCNGILFRNTMGRFLVWREARALKRLSGLTGIPEFRGSVQGLALIMDAVPGRAVEGLEFKEPLPCDFFYKLRDLVNEFHERGIVHCDLKRAPNILLGQDGGPYIVDWSAAISATELRPFPLSLVYRRFLLDDLNAVVKLQLKHRPGEVSPEEVYRYQHRGSLEKVARRIRDKARILLQRIA